MQGGYHDGKSLLWPGGHPAGCRRPGGGGRDTRLGYGSCADTARAPWVLLVQGDRDGGWPSAPLEGLEKKCARAPLYPWLLSLLRERGPDNDAAWVQRIMRWIQCGLGAWTAALYFLFARGAFGNRWVSGVAGLVCAVYPFWIINTAEIQDGVVATFLLALALAGRTCEPGGRGVEQFAVWRGTGRPGVKCARRVLPFAVVAVLWFLFKLPLARCDGPMPCSPSWVLLENWRPGPCVI